MRIKYPQLTSTDSATELSGQDVEEIACQPLMFFCGCDGGAMEQLVRSMDNAHARAHGSGSSWSMLARFWLRTCARIGRLAHHEAAVDPWIRAELRTGALQTHLRSASSLPPPKLEPVSYPIGCGSRRSRQITGAPLANDCHHEFRHRSPLGLIWISRRNHRLAMASRSASATAVRILNCRSSFVSKKKTTKKTKQKNTADRCRMMKIRTWACQLGVG